MMLKFLIRRFLWTLLVLLGVSFITFAILYIVPADIASTIAGARASVQVKAEITRDLGLDQPLWIQYGRYMGRLLKGDLGNSWVYRQSVTKTILQHLPYTAALALAGILFELIFGLPIGLISALKPNSWLDRVLMIFTLVSISAPSFWVGPLLLLEFAVNIPLFPVGGYGSVNHLILPAITIGLAGGAWYARVFRSAILDALDSDYVRAARAKGMAFWRVIVKHIIPNSLTAVISMFAIDLGAYFGGVVVVERVFGWPGIGLTAWKAIQDMDIPILMGTVMFASLIVVLSNLLADILYALVDPRIRLN